MSSSNSNGVRAGKKIQLFEPGDRERTAFSASAMNEIIQALNALLDIRVSHGETDNVVYSDSNVFIQVAAQEQQEDTPTTANVRYRGKYFDNIDYALNDMVYTDLDKLTRMLWICEKANGPGTQDGQQTPAYPPDPVPVYWRCLADVSGPLTMFKITALTNSDFITCRTWDGATQGVDDYFIVKQPQHRCSLTSEVIDGVTINYTAITDNTRTASDSGASENQVIYPRYKVGDVIYAARVTPWTGVLRNGVRLCWLEIKPARVWAKRYQ